MQKGRNFSRTKKTQPKPTKITLNLDRKKDKIEIKRSSKSKETKRKRLSEDEKCKQELNSPGCRGTWKENQVDWISSIIFPVCAWRLYLVFIIFVLRLSTFKQQALWTPEHFMNACCYLIIISKSFSKGFFVPDFVASICSISC